jgi:hypothetical protein
VPRFGVETQCLRAARRRIFAAAVAITLLSAAGGALAEPTPAASPRGRLFTVAGGHSTQEQLRFGRPATASDFHPPTAVLGLPDNSILMGDIDQSRVVRVHATGVLRPFAGNGHEGSSGNGGPATRARFWDPSDLARRPDGAIVILDDIDQTARVVGSDGVIRKLHAFGLDSEVLQSVGALSDNSVLIADVDEDRVLRVAADGRSSVWFHGAASSVAVAGGDAVYMSVDGDEYRTKPTTPPALFAGGSDGVLRPLLAPFAPGVAMAGLPDGSVLAAAGPVEYYEWPKGHNATPDPVVWRVGPDGTVHVVAGGRDEPQGFDGDGDSPVGVNTGATDVSPAADGGMLIAGRTGVRYVAPEQPGLLAAAITRPTLTSPRRLRVSFALTLPADVTVTVLHGSHRVARQDIQAAAGDNVLQFPDAVPAGDYTVDLVARDTSGRVAGDRQVVFLGGVLEGSMARRAASQVIEELNSLMRGGAKVPPLRRCRRMSRTRVDCPDFDTICQEVIAVTLHRDGLPYLRHYYAGYSDRRCVLHRHPHWRGKAKPADPL